MLAECLRATIRGYQLLLSPHLPRSCRFEPTCSHYGYEALGRHGALKGTWLTARRIARCHPFSQGGFDAVPHGDQNGS